MWKRAAVVLSCLLSAGIAFAEDDPCLGKSLREFERSLVTANDPGLRRELARCVEEYRDASLAAERQAAKSSTAVKQLSKEVAAISSSDSSPEEQQEQLQLIALKIGAAGEKLKASEEKKDEDAARADALEKILKADVKRLGARIAVLQKLEDDGQLDDSTALQLEELRRSRRQLEPVARLVADEVQLVTDAFVERKNKKRKDEEETKARNAAERATELCADKHSHTRPEHFKDAASIKKCVDALQLALYPLPEEKKETTATQSQGQGGVDDNKEKSNDKDKGKEETKDAKQVASLGTHYGNGGDSKSSQTTTKTVSEPECDRKCQKQKANAKEEKDERIRLQLARFEEAARRKALLDTLELTELNKKKELSDEEEKKKKALEADLKTLRDFAIVPQEDPQTEFADYEQWYNKFATGYEYASISDAFSKGFPRIGATIGFHYPRNALPENSPRNWHYYGVYSSFALSLTNTAETSTTKFPPEPGPAPADPSEGEGEPTGEAAPTERTIKRALEFESQFFIPLWRNDFQFLNRRLRTRVGPIAVFGARKSDDDLFSHHRAYVGLRTARSPDTFADVMIGRSGGLQSRRLELRGQYALPEIISGGRIVFGATGNFGINKRRRGECEEAASSCRLNEPDSIKFFAAYEVPGGEILKWFGVGN